jgi:mono/diheme cytochrome c family protein
MSDGDLSDLWTYLSAQPAVARANRSHEVRAPFGWRVLLPLWKWMYFRRGPFRPDAARPAQWNRGAYLVGGPGHCSECHTPRTRLGATRDDLYFAGAADGPEGERAPNITPDPETGIGEWRSQDIVWLLQTGAKPDGDSVEGLMAEEIELGYEHLPAADLEAIALYLRSLPPIRHEVEKKK